MRCLPIILLLSALSLPGQDAPIRQFYQSVLEQTSKAGGVTDEDLFTKVNENTLRSASVSVVKDTIPLALQCLHSPNGDVRKAGIVFFISTGMREDSAKLLEPHVDELGTVLDDKDDAPRRAVLYILGSLRPSSPAKAIDYLKANLENSRNSNEDTVTLAATLLTAEPTDATTLHKVLLVTANRSDAVLTNSVIRELGLTGNRLPEAMQFLSTNLDNEDRFARASAVDAVSRLDKDQRAQFSSQLTRIASDPKQPQELRTQASQALAR